MNGINTFKVLEPNSIIEDLVSLIYARKNHFSNSDCYKEVLQNKKNENQHSLAFCLYMNLYFQAKNITFSFSREVAQKGRHTVDIGVFKGAILIYTIEAKLLPTPKGTKASPRFEYEYVYGKGAGIQRYKDNLHGLDLSDGLLRENGLIAFIKKNGFDFWLNNINQWILDTKWDEEEQLKKIIVNAKERLQSEHLRIDNSKVILHHFWISTELEANCQLPTS